jgi:hypothetical protein
LPPEFDATAAATPTATADAAITGKDIEPIENEPAELPAAFALVATSCKLEDSAITADEKTKLPVNATTNAVKDTCFITSSLYNFKQDYLNQLKKQPLKSDRFKIKEN